MSSSESHSCRHQFTNVKLVHRGNSIAQPDVFVAETNGERLLVKDYTPRPLLIRVFLGRRVLRHEHKILTELDGVEGIPRPRGMPDADTLLMEFIDGEDLHDSAEHAAGARFSLEFLHQLKSIIDDMHARGVSHGDIRRRNILRSRDGAPYLIDFATAVSTAGSRRMLRRMLFRACRQADLSAVLRLQRRHFPDSLTEAEARLLEQAPWYLRLGRFLRKRVYRPLIKQRTWKRRFRRLFGASGDSH